MTTMTDPATRDIARATQALRRGLEAFFYPDRRAHRAAAAKLLVDLESVRKQIPGEKVTFVPASADPLTAVFTISGRPATIQFSEGEDTWVVEVANREHRLNDPTGLELRYDAIDDKFVVGDPRVPMPPGIERPDALEALVSKLVELLKPPK
jgi:hypothetical protein